MGRIKSLLIKRTAIKLLEEDNQFTTEFENNKKILGNTMPSKSTRNKIAGYLARLKLNKLKENKPKKEQIVTEEI
jgi:ribosomal protein S17E